jgi:DsbC/DsbD-like thiol-disulfide interchange protein
MFNRVATVGLGMLILLAASTASAQLGGAADTLKVSARFAPAADGKPARLFITADVEKGWHIYSLTQPKGGPLASKIKLSPSDEFKITGDFNAWPKAKSHEEPEIWPDVKIETHKGKVTWYAPIEMTPGSDPAKLSIEGKLNVQACNDRGCLPPKDYKFTAVEGEPIDVGEKQPAEGRSAAP